MEYIAEICHRILLTFRVRDTAAPYQYWRSLHMAVHFIFISM